MRRIEVEADEEWLAGPGVGVHRLDRAAAKLLGEITDLVDLDILVPQIVLLARVIVRVIVVGAAAEAEEVVIPTLERPVTIEYPRSRLIWFVVKSR